MTERVSNKQRRKKRRRRRAVLAAFIPAVVILLILAVFLVWGRDDKTKKAEGGIKSIFSSENQKNTEIVQKKVIMLDSGHGGNDTGCNRGDIYEKDINLAITMRLKKLLEDKGYQVIMTRETDVYVSLEERTDMANQRQPDIFVSIHQNSMENDTESNGIETHYYELPDIDSQKLAETIQNALIKTTSARDRGIFDDRGLYVLKNTTIPACLVETGFLSALDEGKRLSETDYQKKIADGIAQGIENYLNKNIG